MLAEIEERERSAVGFAQAFQRLDGALRVEPSLGRLFDERQAAVLLVKSVEAHGVWFASRPQAFAVQRGEQPRLDLRRIA